ncbi:MAG: ATP-binding protein [Chlamydiales bacterium]
MEREIVKDLITWKNQKHPKPLLVRGARQIGKTHTIEKFGAENFSNCVTLNFEEESRFTECFTTLDPKKIVTAIELMTGKDIIPGKTLLFLDEIQECPKAIMALRYFKEKHPEYHVIGAGSLLEFILHNENFRFPVGRIESLYMRPLTFVEFLDSMGEAKMREHLKEITLENPPLAAIHNKYLDLLRLYLALGGMPEVIYEYSQTQDLSRCQKIQTTLLNSYRDDFGKYAKYTEYNHLRLLYERAPGVIAKWFKYSKIDPDIQSRILKAALHKLTDAGLIYPVHATSASGIPLVATVNEKKFKLLFLDVGLVKRACRIDLDLLLEEDIMLLNQGALAEQFVGQELLALNGPHEPPSLHFWSREKTGSSAEVDYLWTIGQKIFPIEVKAGATGNLRSLKIFMEEKSTPLGIRISTAPLSQEEKIVSIPFYLISEINRIIRKQL